MKHFILTMMIAVILTISSLPVNAQEYSGPAIAIKQLVEQVDREITTFEKKTEGYEDDKGRLQSESDQIHENLTKESNPLAQEALLADLLYNFAQQHKMDWTYIQATKGTLFQLVPRLSRLASEVEKASRMGFTSSEDYQEYQGRLESFLSNSSQILRSVVRSVDDPTLKGNVRDAALALQSARFGLSGAGHTGGASTADVQETIRLLENSIAQLQNIEGSLLAEKYTLQLEGYRSMVRLVISRLDLDGPLSSDKLPSFVKSCESQIQQRHGRLNSAVGHVKGIDPAFSSADYITDEELETMLDDVSESR